MEKVSSTRSNGQVLVKEARKEEDTWILERYLDT